MGGLNALQGTAGGDKLDLRRLLFVTTLGLAAAVTAWIIYLSVFGAGWIGGDFKVFWVAAQLPHQSVYDPAAVSRALQPLGERGIRAFVSPPSFLLLMEPLAQIPLWVAYALWTLAGLALFAGTSVRNAGKSSLLVLLVAPAFHWAVIAGQVTLLVGGLVYAGLILLSRRPTAAGILFACAALLKPQAALLVPLALVAGRHWSALAAAAAAGAAMGLVSLLLKGPSLWLSWVTALGEFNDLIRSNGFIANGITPAAFAHSAGLDGAAALALAGGAALLGIVCCWKVFRRSDDPALRGGAVVCGSLLCTPYALPYEAASLLAAAALLLTRSNTPWPSLPAAALAIAFPFSPLTIGLFAVGLLLAVRGAAKTFVSSAPPSPSEPPSSEPPSSAPLSSPGPSSALVP